MPRRARIALLGAAALIGLLLATWLATFHVWAVERADALIYNGFHDLQQHPHVWSVANALANLCDPRPYVVLCMLPLSIALLRRRFTLAATILVILVGANETAQVLKPLLASPRPSWLLATGPIAPGSWPSGHATASMALALCVVLASPARLRPLAAALGAAFAVAVSYSFLTLGWHYPSDALGGFLVATIWTLLGVAGLDSFEARPRRDGRREPTGSLTTTEALTVPATALFGTLLAAGLIVLARPDDVLSYAGTHTWFVVGAAAIGAMALTLSTAVMMTLRN
ncbi:MAG: phosphatase PAP2 family protein [Solirubrobacteraceae bacterium]